jgi:hypothetical protein
MNETDTISPRYNREEAARLYQRAANSGRWEEANRLRKLIENHGG